MGGQACVYKSVIHAEDESSYEGRADPAAEIHRTMRPFLYLPAEGFLYFRPDRGGRDEFRFPDIMPFPVKFHERQEHYVQTGFTVMPENQPYEVRQGAAQRSRGEMAYRAYLLLYRQHRGMQGLDQWQILPVKSGKLLHFTLEPGDEQPVFIRLDGENYDGAFASTEESIKANIGEKFMQPPILRCEQVSNGFADDMMRQAYDFYNSITEPDRMYVESVFVDVLRHWYRPVDLSALRIEPLSYNSSTHTTDANQ